MEWRVDRPRMQWPIAALVAALVFGSGTATAAPTVSGTGAPVPPSLKAVESGAEDLVDFALGGDRARVRATALQLKSEAHGPAAVDLRAAKVAATDIALLGRRADRVATLAASGPMIRVALAANAVSALMPGFYARFADRVPSSVLTLDYLDREAQLRSLADDQKAVVSSVQALATVWPAVRRRVLAVGGLREARKFDAHVAAMKRHSRSSDRKALQQEAVNGLNLVDTLESLFA